MSTDPVLIDDDDVDMVPVVILDEDGEKTTGKKCAQRVETIDLDVESPIITGEQVKNDAAISINRQSETAFIINLKNNKLMDKIVRRCLKVENAAGMSRVVYRTMLPLYRDTTNTFKQSESFRALLKKTYKQLMKDPDHKFLHIKTLCEELKSGGLRRKVPFVTLANNLENNGSQWDHKELTSSSREINQQDSKKLQPHRVYKNNKTKTRVCGSGTKRKETTSKSCAVNTKSCAVNTKSCAVNTKKRIKTRSVTITEKKKTDNIIDLDDSDTESENTLENGDGQNDVIFIEETEPSDQRNDNLNTVLQETLEADSKKDSKVAQETLEADSNKENKVVQEDSNKESNNEPSKSSNNEKGNKVAQETFEADSNKENKVVQEDPNKESNNEPSKSSNNKKGNKVAQETLEADSNKENKVVQEDPNKESNNETSKSSDNEIDYELLIPKAHVEVLPVQDVVSDTDLEIIRLEKQIAMHKMKIDQLEEAEVTSESPFASSYYLCSKYKEVVLACYKKICELRGACKDIVQRHEIRMIVAEGHPPGPAKKLEEFLNSTIDNTGTGTVEFPDFSDVVKCVVQSNLTDNLGWNRQQVMQEAIALFRQCGQALRKRRQKREYKDLLSLVRHTEETDDPAENDPILLAKLQENKLIASRKEVEILDRYVRMEDNVSQSVEIPQVGNAVLFESETESAEDSSSSDDEIREININLPSYSYLASIATSIVNNQLNTGDCSRNQFTLSLSPTNNLTIRTNGINHCRTGSSWITNDVVLNVEGTANENQCAMGESSLMSDAISYDDCDMLPTITRSLPPNTMHNECETFECSHKEEIVNSNLELTITETVVGFNNSTLNCNSDTSMRNGEKTGIPENNEPCNDYDVQDHVSSTTDGTEQNCVASTSQEDFELMTEDNIKREPLDIQKMLDELGNDFECQVIDIEDPFLVIEISSDGFTDDDEL